MVSVISNGFPGLTLICRGCRSLLAYTPSDVYEKKWVYCPLCKEKNEVNIVW